ncbi:hypothetical protein KY306_00645 [Candidatus Woesearchaeota archaeon]|nr:hypothetical protein [Candidatus Woesearchaeota archaeon]
MYQAVITCFDDLENIYQAFKPEESQDQRCSFQIKKKKNSIEFVIKAQDAVSLRAMMASITRLLTIYHGRKKTS